MPFANLFKNTLSTLAFVFVTTQAQAAKFEYNITPQGQLAPLHYLLQNLVAQTNNGFDIHSAAHLILSKKPSEKIENSIKQLHHAGHAPYVECVSAKVAKSTPSVYEALRSVLASAGLDKSGLQFASPSQIELIEKLFKTVETHVEKSSYITVIYGSIHGPTLHHSYISFVDQATGEVVVFEAGTSD